MNKPDVTKLFKNVKVAMTKHSPEILTGLGIAGMITTTVLAVKATPKALLLLEDARHEKGEKLTKTEKVKAAWKPYVPAAVTGTVSIACLVGASSVNAKRNAALATAYQLSTTALADYKEKVIETIGEKKEKTIREKVAEKKITENPVAKSEIIVTGNGDVTFLDPVSMRYFSSDIEYVRKIINDLNYRMVSGMEGYISLSEFYDEVGLTHTSASDYIGWNLHKDGQLSVDFVASKTDNGKPCLMLEYMVMPRYGFQEIM